MRRIIDRRSFLKTGVAGAAMAPLVLGGIPVRAGSTLEALAQLPGADGDRILILVQLFGGNDGLNMLLPMHDEEEYLRIRPRLAIPRDKAWNYQQSVYLHPALARGSRGGVARMLEQGSLALIQGVGYDNPNLSHFRSTDIWLSGINDSDPNARLDTGWIGRHLEKRYPSFPLNLPDHPLAVQLGGFSLTLLSSKGRMGIEVSDPDKQQSLTPQLDTLDPDSVGTAYEAEVAFVADIAGRSNRYAAAVREAYAAGRTRLAGTYGTDSFARQMASVAALIAGGLRTQVYVVSMGGFDTHFTQQADLDYGTHPLLLERLSDGIAQFTYDMTRLDLSDRVVGLTVSEFGRRPAENGSFGTDHGASSVQLLWGSQVNSGVFGFPPDLRNLNANGDLIYQIDYREVYAEILGDWFGASEADVADVLRDDTIRPIDVLKSPASVTWRNDAARGLQILGLSPNPATDGTTLELRASTAVTAEITLTSMDGRTVQGPFRRPLTTGDHRLRLPLTVPPGTYVASVRAGGAIVSQPLQVVR